MGMLKPDLYRSFAIGFAVGAVVVFSQLGAVAAETVVPFAVSATPAASSVSVL